ncbi:MAG: hypothetical protein M1828_007137 [Chrysothrix sp. TS-e1954]|nr:MAG: hypothetical protein M1828_007137 [Chrysothrix sp. TS-e1954]
MTSLIARNAVRPGDIWLVLAPSLALILVLKGTIYHGDLFNSPRLWASVELVSIYTICYQTVVYIYHRYFSPLSAFPGPLANKISKLPMAASVLFGNLPFWTWRLHENYGEIVRTGPESLSFTGETAWRDIYAHRQGVPAFPKYMSVPPPGGAHSITTTPSEADHSRMRRLLAHAFSDKALREQEPLIKSYVDLLMQRLREQPRDRYVNMVRWLSYTTFDIVAHLSFGESFHCLHENTYDPWVTATFDGMKFGLMLGVTRWFPPFEKVIQQFVPKSMQEARVKNYQNTVEKVTRRIDSGDPENPDFMSYIMKYNDEKGMSRGEINSSVTSLFAAGSDTTASHLSGMLYHVLKNRAVHDRLRSEIRDTFKSEDEITVASTEDLTYLMAVMQESFRIYPPAPSALVRIVPGEGAEVCGTWVPGGTAVSVTQYAINHDTKNWRDHNTFIPERWLDASGEFDYDLKSTLNPFSAGPRNCIGKNLANAEMKLIMSRLFWNFDVQLDQKCDDWTVGQKAWGFWEKPGLNVWVTPREQ